MSFIDFTMSEKCFVFLRTALKCRERRDGGTLAHA
jgi:hypothetical protein